MAETYQQRYRQIYGEGRRGIRSNTSYINRIGYVKKYLTELEALALKRAGSYAQKRYRDIVYSKVKKRTGILKRYVRYRLRGREGAVALGFYKRAFYGNFFEKGPKKRGEGIMGEILQTRSGEIKQLITKTLGAMITEEQAKAMIKIGASIPEEG